MGLADRSGARRSPPACTTAATRTSCGLAIGGGADPWPAARRLALLGLLLAAAATAAAAGDGAPDPIVTGDRAWQRRAEGSEGQRAAAGPIGRAVEAYERALAEAPASIPTRERLLRALSYQGQYATPPGPARRALYLRGRQLAEEGIRRLASEAGLETPLELRPAERLATALAARPEAAVLFFWSAAHWGLWGETSGPLAAARQGVAAEVRDRAELAALLDESYEQGGGHRILGRLHTEAPRIPLVTGWVDRDEAVGRLERALALGPDERLNRLYLADALLRFRRGRRGEALTLLEKLAGEPLRAGWLLEDRSARAQARELLRREAR